jgi:hypothetical protein
MTLHCVQKPSLCYNCDRESSEGDGQGGTEGATEAGPVAKC